MTNNLNSKVTGKRQKGKGQLEKNILNKGKMQVPGAVCLTSEEWGPESGLVTAAMKLKRRPLQVIWNILLLRSSSCTLFLLNV